MTPFDLNHVYFHQARNGFFRWDDDGQVLVWDNGLTISFREELTTVLQKLAAQGRLPPLNAVATLLSACQSNWPEARWFLSLLADDVADVSLREICDCSPAWDTSSARQLRNELDRIHAIEHELRSSTDARCELAAMVFESCTPSTDWPGEAAAQAAIDQLIAGLPESLESQGGLLEVIAEERSATDTVVIDSSETQLLPTAYLHRDARMLMEQLRCLRTGLRQVAEDSLARRVKTGVEDELNVARQDEPGTVRALIGQLMHDEELGGLARLASQLLALLTFPRPLSQPDELPLGGVSDITNRGQLDRLLLSELAHDDETLATRVALNEALYFHREAPPTARSRQRRVLLDTGLCMWGVPRLFATAAGLSMAAAADETVHLDFCRPVIDGTERVDLTTRQGIEDHLAQLSPELFPTAALSTFFADDHDTEAEHIIVTEADVANDLDFLRQLRELAKSTSTFLVAVNRMGQLTLSVMGQHGIRILKSGQLNLDDLLKAPVRRLSLHNGQPDLPIVLQQQELPLRLFHQIDVNRGFRCELGIIMCTGDGRLMLWDKDRCGAKQLTDKLGRGRLWWCGFDLYGVPMLVFGTDSSSALKLIRVHEDGSTPITQLRYEGTASHVSGFGGYIFLEFADRWEMFRSGRSERIAVKRKPTWAAAEVSSISGASMSAASRFVPQRTSSGAVDAWYGLAASSGDIDLQLIPLKSPSRVDMLYDRRGYGVVAVSQQRILQRTYGDEACCNDLGHSVVITDIAADGSRVVGVDVASRVHIRLTDTFASERASSVVNATLALTDSDCVVSTLRKKFRSISVVQGRLFLRSPKGAGLLIHDRSAIQLTSASPKQEFKEISFVETDPPEGCRYSLHVARWPCGSRAYLDGRGVLHLVSCDPEVPQISLALRDGRMSGWCESGGAFGIEYYLLDDPDTPAKHDEEIYRKAIEGFTTCINSH